MLFDVEARRAVWSHQLDEGRGGRSRFSEHMSGSIRVTRDGVFLPVITSRQVGLAGQGDPLGAPDTPELCSTDRKIDGDIFLCAEQDCRAALVKVSVCSNRSGCDVREAVRLLLRSLGRRITRTAETSTWAKKSQSPARCVFFLRSGPLHKPKSSKMVCLRSGPLHKPKSSKMVCLRSGPLHKPKSSKMVCLRSGPLHKPKSSKMVCLSGPLHKPKSSKMVCLRSGPLHKPKSSKMVCLSGPLHKPKSSKMVCLRSVCQVPGRFFQHFVPRAGGGGGRGGGWVGHGVGSDGGKEFSSQ